MKLNENKTSPEKGTKEVQRKRWMQYHGFRKWDTSLIMKSTFFFFPPDSHKKKSKHLELNQTLKIWDFKGHPPSEICKNRKTESPSRTVYSKELKFWASILGNWAWETSSEQKPCFHFFNRKYQVPNSVLFYYFFSFYERTSISTIRNFLFRLMLWSMKTSAHQSIPQKGKDYNQK